MFSDIQDSLVTIGVAIALILGGFVLIFLLAFAVVKFEEAHPCIRSHEETQTEMPMYLQPGKDGGIAIPLGNMKQVQVTVCDERK